MKYWFMGDGDFLAYIVTFNLLNHLYSCPFEKSQQQNIDLLATLYSDFLNWVLDNILQIKSHLPQRLLDFIQEHSTMVTMVQLWSVSDKLVYI